MAILPKFRFFFRFFVSQPKLSWLWSHGLRSGLPDVWNDFGPDFSQIRSKNWTLLNRNFQIRSFTKYGQNWKFGHLLNKNEKFWPNEIKNSVHFRTFWPTFRSSGSPGSLVHYGCYASNLFYLFHLFLSVEEIEETEEMEEVEEVTSIAALVWSCQLGQLMRKVPNKAARQAERRRVELFALTRIYEVQECNRTKKFQVPLFSSQGV